MPEHIVTRKVYVTVWAALMCLTVLTAVLSLHDLDYHFVWSGHPHVFPFSSIIAVAIAVTKALLIALLFMHIRYADKVTRVVAVASIFWLGIMFVLTATDFFTRIPSGVYPPRP